MIIARDRRVVGKTIFFLLIFWFDQHAAFVIIEVSPRFFKTSPFFLKHHLIAGSLPRYLTRCSLMHRNGNVHHCYILHFDTFRDKFILFVHFLFVIEIFPFFSIILLIFHFFFIKIFHVENLFTKELITVENLTKKI